MRDFLEVDLEAIFYNEGLQEGAKHDISSELVSAEHEAASEASRRAALVGHALGYLDGLDWLVSSGHLQASSSLRSTTKELKELCARVPSGNEEFPELDALLTRILLLVRKCKAILAVPNGISLSPTAAKCKSIDF